MFLSRIMKIHIEIYEEINIYVYAEIKKEAPQWEGASFYPFSGKAFRVPTEWMLLVTTRSVA